MLIPYHVVRNVVGFSYRSQIELLDFAALELFLQSFPGDHSYYLHVSWRFVLSISISSLLIDILLPLTSIFPNSNPARSISFYLKKSIPTIASNCGTGSKYSDFVIIVFPILNSNDAILYMNCALALFTTRSIDHDLI